MKKIISCFMAVLLCMLSLSFAVIAEEPAAETFDVNIVLEWDDFRDKYSNRPSEVNVSLFRADETGENPECICSFVLSDENNWVYTVTELSKEYSARYYVEVESLDAYDSRVTRGCSPEDVLAVASEEIGYFEKASMFAIDDKTANTGTNDYTKYARDMYEYYPRWYIGNKNGYGWCDVFADWCFIKTFGYRNALDLLCQPERSAGAICRCSLDYFNQKGQFHTEDPRPGDQVFFGTSLTNVSHVEIVERADDDYIYTIGGNCSDRVKSIKRRISTAGIIGYGRPDYESFSNTFTIIETLKTERLCVSRDWRDNDNVDNTRPESVNTALLRDGEQVDTLDIIADYEWFYAWYNLPCYVGGVEVQYDIFAEDIDGYYTECIFGDDLYNFTHILNSLRGDFNGDGIITIEDASALLNAILFGGWLNQNGDLNGDNTVSIEDATYLLNCILFGNSIL